MKGELPLSVASSGAPGISNSCTAHFLGSVSSEQLRLQQRAGEFGSQAEQGAVLGLLPRKAESHVASALSWRWQLEFYLWFCYLNWKRCCTG